jgi:TatD DNase family protein
LFVGGLCKDSSGSGIKKLLNAGTLTLDRILVQSDSPFMYPNARAANLTDALKSNLTQRYIFMIYIYFEIIINYYVLCFYRSLGFLQRYCTFHRNEPCSLPILVELLAGFISKKPDEVALATSINALKIFGMS